MRLYTGVGHTEEIDDETAVNKRKEYMRNNDRKSNPRIPNDSLWPCLCFLLSGL